MIENDVFRISTIGGDDHEAVAFMQSLAGGNASWKKDGSPKDCGNSSLSKIKNQDPPQVSRWSSLEVDATPTPTSLHKSVSSLEPSPSVITDDVTFPSHQSDTRTNRHVQPSSSVPLSDGSRAAAIKQNAMRKIRDKESRKRVTNKSPTMATPTINSDTPSTSEESLLSLPPPPLCSLARSESLFTIENHPTKDQTPKPSSLKRSKTSMLLEVLSSPLIIRRKVISKVEDSTVAPPSLQRSQTTTMHINSSFAATDSRRDLTKSPRKTFQPKRFSLGRIIGRDKLADHDKPPCPTAGKDESCLLPSSTADDSPKPTSKMHRHKSLCEYRSTNEILDAYTKIMADIMVDAKTKDDADSDGTELLSSPSVLCEL